MIFERISRNFQLRFKDRVSAASILADTTKSSVRKEAKNDTLVFGIPRGGVITADILATKLNIPNFDIITPRKLTDPDNKEQAIGSIMEDGTIYLDEQQIRDSGISSDYVEKEKLTQIAEIKRRTEVYHSKVRHYRNSVNSTIILVDDGAANRTSNVRKSGTIDWHVLSIQLCVWHLYQGSDRFEQHRNPYVANRSSMETRPTHSGSCTGSKLKQS